MKQKFTRAYFRKVGNDEGLLTAVIGSTDTVDRYGESIDQSSWDLKHFKKNPVILWAHNLTMGEDRPPIGKAAKVKVVDNQLQFDIQFDMGDPFAADIFRKYKEGFLSAFSVGFIPHTIKRYDEEGQPLENPVLMDNELLELSAVPVPANPEALNSLRARSFKTKTWDKLMKEVDAEEKDEDDSDDEEVVTDPKPADPKPAEEQPAGDPPVADPDANVVPATPEAVAEALKGLDAKTIAEVLAKNYTASQIKEITDVVMATSSPEDKGGSGSDPKTPQLGGGNKNVLRTMRLATKLLQGALAEANAELRKQPQR